MTKDEALKMALEALEGKYSITASMLNQQFQALTAIKEALAQPAQEPVAWGYRNNAGAIYDCISPEAHADEEGDYDVPLYATPPQRPWVGLDEQDFSAINQSCLTKLQAAISAESVLKEKNT